MTTLRTTASPLRSRVVVVGHGMAGARVVEELRAHDPGHLLHVTVLGEEPEAAYNRVLLSEVLAGRHRADDIRLGTDAWSDDHGVDRRLGSAAISIDRSARTVTTAAGDVVDYGVLILATGSRAAVPPIDGLSDSEGALVPGAFVFRTLEDCRGIEAAIGGARRAVVLGGGLLGLEAARGLAGRGLDVVVVHAVGHLMERQLDPDAGAILRRSLAGLGVQVRLGAATTGVMRDADGRFAGLALGDGGVVLADLLVVSCGVRPEVSLAKEAGLLVERGVVVDNGLRSVVDDRVYAIGECAQHDGQVYGLVAPAWEQAAVVAARVTGARPDARYAGSRLVTRLKTEGIDLASMGETDAVHDPDGGDDAEVVVVSDPARGSYGKLVVRDGRLAGAILVGSPSAVGAVTQAFDRRSLLPSDRIGMLLPGRGRAAEPDTPDRMPRTATVCRCNGVTKGAIQDCVLAGARTVEAVADVTRAATGCGGCRPAVEGIVDWLNAAEPHTALRAVAPDGDDADPFGPVPELVTASAAGERRPA